MTWRWYFSSCEYGCIILKKTKLFSTRPMTIKGSSAAFDWVEKLSTVSVVACTAWVWGHWLVVSSLALVSYGWFLLIQMNPNTLLWLGLSNSQKIEKKTSNNIQQLSKTLQLQGISLGREFAPLLWPRKRPDWDGLGLLLRWFGQWGSHQRPPALNTVWRQRNMVSTAL